MSGSDATTPILLALGWGTINPREIGGAGVDVSSTDSNLNCSQVGAGEGQWQAELRRRGADVSWAFEVWKWKMHGNSVLEPCYKIYNACRLCIGIINQILFHLMISHAFLISLRWCARTLILVSFSVGGLCLKFAIYKIDQNQHFHHISMVTPAFPALSLAHFQVVAFDNHSSPSRFDAAVSRFG